MTPETFAGSQFFKGPTSFGFLVLLICLISANVCISTSPTRKPGSGAIVSASSSANSLSLPVFGPNVGEMSIADRDNLHKMVKNVLKFYEHSMRPLDQAKSRISWGAIKNTVALGVNFCQAAISMTSGLKVAPRFPVEDEFFEMLAGVGRAISNRANELVGSKSYSKTNVDRLVLKQRAQTMLDNIHKIVGDSVYGLYLQWDKLASMEDPNEAGKRLDMLEELADIIAVSKGHMSNLCNSQ